MNDREYLEMIEETYRPEAQAGRQDVLYCMVGLAGEAGEIANMAQKAMRGDWGSEHLPVAENMTGPEGLLHMKQRAKLLEEMGGVYYFWRALCRFMGVTPGEVMARNAAKLRGRLARGTTRGDGDER